MENRVEIGSRKIVLIGMMGSGKSSAGRRLARTLNSSFVDLDQNIERRAGRSIREIFAADGEQVFRDLEEHELRSVLQEPGPLVVAAGGGIVLRAANRELLAAADQVIWLQASLEVLVQRVEARALRHEGHRPLVDGDPRARLRTLMAERQSLYEEVATAMVVVGDQSLEEVVTALTALVGPEGEL